MLKQRLVTALLLGAMTIWAIFSLSTSTLALIFAMATLLGGWEWSALVALRGQPRRIAYTLLLVPLLYLAWSGELLQRQLLLPLLASTLLIWGVILGAILAYRGDRGMGRGYRLLHALAGLWLLMSAWISLLLIHAGTFSPAIPGEWPPGAVMLLYLLLLIWSADSGAYFAGRRFGRHKLAPTVSPGKTREGVYGALLTVALLALLAGAMLGLELLERLLFLLLSLLTAAISVVGDLYESLLKRRRGVKDSSRLLPGHGGVLDRIDSLLAAAPLFLSGLYLMEGVV